MLPADNSYFMFRHLPDAKLILCPSLFQYHEFFTPQVELFLNDHQQQRRAA
jgi:hypothetical protein